MLSRKLLELQSAAYDLGLIIDTVDALGKLLDRFHADHGEELYEKLETAWPDARNFGGTASKPLYDLGCQWNGDER